MSQLSYFSDKYLFVFFWKIIDDDILAPLYALEDSSDIRVFDHISSVNIQIAGVPKLIFIALEQREQFDCNRGIIFSNAAASNQISSNEVLDFPLVNLVLGHSFKNSTKFYE